MPERAPRKMNESVWKNENMIPNHFSLTVFKMFGRRGVINYCIRKFTINIKCMCVYVAYTCSDVPPRMLYCPQAVCDLGEWNSNDLFSSDLFDV